MRNVTARTGKLFPRPRGIWLAFGWVSVAESVPSKDVFARSLAVVAGTAELVHWHFKKRSHVRGMGDVARCALTHGYGRVNILLREYPLVVTGKTQVRGIGDQELCVLARMRTVAGGATHAYGGVYYFFVKK